MRFHPDSKIETIVDDFILRHDLSALIVYGSYARGDHTATSDLDLFGIKEGVDAYTDVRVIQGIQLDGWIHSPESLSKVEDFLKIQGGLVLKDDYNIAESFLRTVQQTLNKGPTPLTTNEKEHISVWIRKMVNRAEVSDLEGLYRRNWISFELLYYYFKLRNRFFLGSKMGFQTLRLENKKAFEAYEHCLREPQNYEALKALSEIVLDV